MRWGIKGIAQSEEGEVREKYDKIMELTNVNSPTSNANCASSQA